MKGKHAAKADRRVERKEAELVEALRTELQDVKRRLHDAEEAASLVPGLRVSLQRATEELVQFKASPTYQNMVRTEAALEATQERSERLERSLRTVCRRVRDQNVSLSRAEFVELQDLINLGEIWPDAFGRNRDDRRYIEHASSGQVEDALKQGGT